MTGGGFYLLISTMCFFFPVFPLFLRFFPGRTHPQFCGCQHWFWGSKKLIKIFVGMGGRMVGIFGSWWWLWEIGEKSPIKWLNFTNFSSEDRRPACSIPLFRRALSYSGMKHIPELREKKTRIFYRGFDCLEGLVFFLPLHLVG